MYLKKIEDWSIQAVHNTLEELNRLIDSWLTDKLGHFYPEIRKMKIEWLSEITDNYNIEIVQHDSLSATYTLRHKHGELISVLYYKLDIEKGEIKYGIN